MSQRTIIDRLSPLWLGIGISGSFIAILLVTETVLGRWDALLIEGEFDALARVSGGVLRDVRIAIVHCLVLGYLPAALLHVFRSGRRTVLKLQGALDCTRDECETLAASIRLSPRGVVITGATGFVLAFAAPYLVAPVPDAPWNPSEWNPEIAWHRILGPILFMGQMWLAYAVVTVSLRLSRVAKKLSHINLLDLAPLAPFAAQGMTNALLLIGLLSIWSLMMLETGFGHMMIIVGSSTLVLSALALLSPVQGVNKRIRQAKEVELGWANEQISRRRIEFRDPGPEQRGGEMADLVAYRSLVESVPEWPFTTSTYTRLALYLFIPLLTWGFGVVAEEVVGRTLF